MHSNYYHDKYTWAFIDLIKEKRIVRTARNKKEKNKRKWFPPRKVFLLSKCSPQHCRHRILNKILHLCMDCLPQGVSHWGVNLLHHRSNTLDVAHKFNQSLPFFSTIIVPYYLYFNLRIVKLQVSCQMHFLNLKEKKTALLNLLGSSSVFFSSFFYGSSIFFSFQFFLSFFFGCCCWGGGGKRDWGFHWDAPLYVRGQLAT